MHPNWWGQPPAILKGWIDRVIRPGVAYEFLEGDSGEGVPIGLLRAEMAVVFNTSNTPQAREVSAFGDPLETLWKNCIFGLCGVKGFSRRMFGVIVTSTAEQRAAWLNEVTETIDRCFPADGPSRRGELPMRIYAIDHVQLAMPPGGETQARAFYGGILGLDELPKPAELAGRGGAWFSNGAVTLHLGVEQEFRPARKAHPALLVEGLAELVTRLEGAGHPIQRDVQLGGRRARPCERPVRQPHRVDGANRMTACIFCDIVGGTAPASIIYRDELCTAFMDIQPVNPGHLLVVPNRHASHLADLPPETGGQMFRVAQQSLRRCARAASAAKGSTSSWRMARPRGRMSSTCICTSCRAYAGDGFGFRFGPAYGMRPPRSELDRLAEQIRHAL